MVHLAACLAGFGGLLLEMVFVRRHGLLIGNTAGASAMVFAWFLLGLGLGGLLLPRTALARRRPLGVAAILYGGVAVTAAAGDVLLSQLPPLGSVQGAVLALLVPGLPALLMGGAFPLLFAVFDRNARPWRAAVLVGANLLGSVVATFVGGNFAIPLLGMSVCAWIGVAAYGATALLVAVLSRFERPIEVVDDPPPLVAIGRDEVTVLAAGFVVLALEVMMLRRLPFFLDGFQPTLSGVLAACLLGATLGSVFGPPAFRRLFGERAVAGSVFLGVAIAALGLHEWAAPAVGRIGVDSDMGFHLRIVAAAFVAAGLPFFCLGATIPLCLERFVHPETRAPLAGRLFFFQGLGSLCGAITVGQVLPRVLATTFFVYGVTVVLLVGLLVALFAWGPRWKLASAGTLVWVLAAGGFGLTGGTVFRHDPAPVAGSRYDHPERYVYLEHRTDEVTTASVVYDRRSHGLILFTDEFRAAYIDPDSGYMKVLGHLPFLLRENLRRVAVVALGTGTTANAVSLWPDPEELHVVEISPAVVSLVDHFAKDGPAIAPVRAPFEADPRTRTHVTDGRRFVARRDPGSLDLISMEPLLPYAPGTVPLYTREFYAHCARALSDHGLMVQWVPTHSMPEDYFRTLIATFARGFAHHSVWLLNHSTLLIGSKHPHLPPIDELRGRMIAMPVAVRRDLHDAGLVTADDVIAAMVGSDALRVCDVPDLVDDRPFLERLGYWGASTRLGFLGGNLAVLREIANRPREWPGVREWSGLRMDRLQGLCDLANGTVAGDKTANALAILSLSRTRDRLPASVLLYGELRRAQRTLVEKEVLLVVGDRSTFDSRVDTRRIRRHLTGDPGSAFLWAVLAARERDKLARHNAMRTALALDPTIFDQWAMLRVERAPEPGVVHDGPFAAIALLPEGRDLVRRAVEPGAVGVAFRARFRVKVGYACLGLLATAPLVKEHGATFRAVLDPAFLTFAVIAVRAREGDVVREILPLWRRDLPIPEGLDALLREGPDKRSALASALSGRKGRPELALLGRLLMDTDLAVRRVASVTLFRTLGDAVTYDPESSEAERREAVEQLKRVRRSR